MKKELFMEIKAELKDKIPSKQSIFIKLFASNPPIAIVIKY